MTTQRAAFTVEALRLGYGDLIAVWDVSLSVHAGRTTALVGRNGAGKSTLLSGMAGLLPARGGRVLVGERDVTKAPAHDRIASGVALVQEGKRIFRKLTVRENLLIGLRGSGARRSTYPQRLDRIYSRFDMFADRTDHVAGSLSGGQQQMLAIATALAAEPSVLLVDEPSSGLAPVYVDRVFAVLSELRAEGMAILLVEQLVEEVLHGIADDVVVIEQGRVQLADRAENISAEELARGIYATS